VIGRRVLLAGVALGLAAGAALVLWSSGESGSEEDGAAARWWTVDHVVDGDTIVVEDDVTVRLVQIDAPETRAGPECYGEEASSAARRLLPRGSDVRLVRDRATDDVDRFGRRLRWVVRRDGVEVNLRLVEEGAAAPYFFDGVRGAHARELERAAEEARAARKGLWGACPGTPLDPERAVETGPP
jgi:micrococcal nuclease